MTDPMPTADRIRRLFEPTPRGAVGLADALIDAGRDHLLRIEYRDGRCRVHAGTDDAVEVSIPKSAFRAALARIAALCNERQPDSVSPYRGTGEAAVPGDPAAVVRVAFTNTPADQLLVVRAKTAEDDGYVEAADELFRMFDAEEAADPAPSE